MSAFEFRRSVLAQRQREEEQLKGKLTAEEARRQVRISFQKHFQIQFLFRIERASSTNC